jgi:hypothetical protein
MLKRAILGAGPMDERLLVLGLLAACLVNLACLCAYL